MATRDSLFESEALCFQLFFHLIQRHSCNDTKVAIARGLHLFPFRTEKLNLATPMILRKWKSR